MGIFNRKYIDLHVHTSFSDGTFSPEEVVGYALKTNLSAIAITDHDCVDGIERAVAAAENTSLEIIPGVELSAEIDNSEIHIVGLFLDYKQEWFQDKLKEIRMARMTRMHKMVEKLNNLGIDISIEDVTSMATEGGAIGRLHLARALYKKGLTRSVRAAFDRFIGAHGPCYVKRMILTPKDAIEMIRKLNGIAVFAHPGNMRLDHEIPKLIECGLNAIEVYHIDHSRRKSQHYLSIAKKYKLLISGGSDCHGAGKGFPLMGMVKVPYGLLEKLKKTRNNN